MRKRIIKGGAWAMALFTVLSLLSIGRNAAYAAPGIDLTKECSVEFTLPDGGELPNGTADEKYAGYYGELARLLEEDFLTVKLYKVAEVSINGRYTPVQAFESLGDSLKNIGQNTSAAEWEEMARAAQEISQAVAPAKTAEIRNENMVINELSTGMYLVCVETKLTDAYAYGFVPFMLSLPDHYYYQTGNDEWVYGATVGLKPERTDRYGRLQITKTLNQYNSFLGEATFVFEITAVRGDGEAPVYNNVVSLTFDGTSDTRSVIVDRIPAGSVAVVEEVYSGASYEPVSATRSEGILIVANESEEDETISGTAAFTNRYDGGFKAGAGVENHFVYEGGTDGSWNWVSPEE